jgi:hypothetical protein
MSDGCWSPRNEAVGGLGGGLYYAPARSGPPLPPKLPPGPPCALVSPCRSGPGLIPQFSRSSFSRTLRLASTSAASSAAAMPESGSL